MIDRATVDTNILIYALDTSEGAKHESARNLVRKLMLGGFNVPLQALNEFYFACVKKRFTSLADAETFIHAVLESSRAVSIAADDLLVAMERNRRDGIQFFDALLMATASRAGCTVFFSEDMQHGRSYGGLTVMNPFKMTAQEIDEALG